MPKLVQHDPDNQPKEDGGRTARAASYPPTRFGYQSQPINSQTKYENYRRYCASKNEAL